MKYIKFINLFIIKINIILAQEIPQDFVEYKVNKFFNNAGQNWVRNTTIGSLRFQELEGYNQGSVFLKNDSLSNVVARVGLKSINHDLALYYYGRLIFHSNFFVYLYPRIVTDSEVFARYSGVERKISRYGFRSGETELSGFGYQNNWFLLQIGRGKEDWSAGNNISLGLSNHSPSYDYGLFGLDFGKFRYKYFHGFLESDSTSVNRYISGKGVEYSNNENLIISVSEITVYSGINRAIDVAYLNPISSHLEIELNNRSAQLGTDGGNAIWQIAIDSKIYKKFRLSINFLIDELVLDKEQIDAGKVNGTALSTKLVWPKRFNDYFFNFYLAYINIGTHTFRHQEGSNNFVQRGFPLGSKLGSDVYDFFIGCEFYNNNNIFSSFEFGKKNTGERSIINNPYEPYENYNKTSFPSGINELQNYFKLNLEYWMSNSVSFSTDLSYLSSEKRQKDLSINFGVNIFLERVFNNNF